MQNKPEFVTLNDNGSVVVMLQSGLNIDGEKRTHVILREPTVADHIAASKSASGDAPMSEVNLIANLAEISPEAVLGAKMKDYGRLQQALAFLNG